ncbi:polyphosphate kinase 2 family protein [soil metagenome]
MATTVRDLLRLPEGPVDLGALDTRATQGAPGRKKATRASMTDHAERLATLQEALYAEGSHRGRRRVLLVLQGMDTAGKGGVIKHVVGMMNPQGVRITSFKAPTEQELAHHYLWRIRRAVPAPGFVGVFDRSHYEDVLIVRVQELVEPAVWERRYAEINRFERDLVADGVTLVKCFLHLSADEQKARLLARLDDPSKHWKFNPVDVAQRRRWADYQEAYAAALQRCHTETAPWYVVPSDRKWYRNWAVAQLLIETLTELDPTYPRMRFDVDVQRRRLRAT